jgi:transcriptional regulator GlxA family with amidase domain
MAARAAISNRTLIRRFREQTGTTPMQWLTRYRVRRAQQLLETTDVPVEQVGPLAGFAAATTFRERFKEVVGVSPWAYRRAFQSRPRSPASAGALEYLARTRVQAALGASPNFGVPLT